MLVTMLVEVLVAAAQSMLLVVGGRVSAAQAWFSAWVEEKESRVDEMYECI